VEHGAVSGERRSRWRKERLVDTEAVDGVRSFCRTSERLLKTDW
jgi:hypothetical protein